MNPDEIALIAQKISFAYEDQFFDEQKKEQFHSFFVKYFAGVDPGGNMEPYDAAKALGRQDPEQFDLMLKAMKDSDLISD